MAFNETALNAYLRRKYDKQYVSDFFSKKKDAILRTIGAGDTDGGGLQYAWLADADDSFNGSADFTIAQTAATNNNNTVGSQFLTNWNNFHATAQLTADVIGKTRNSDGAWQKAADVAQEKTLAGVAHANAVFLQGYGWGEISKIQNVSGSTFKPNPLSAITKYIRGMPLHFSASLHGNGLRTATVIYVTGVSYTAGAELVTCNAAVAPGANGDYAFIAGCRQDSGTPSRIAMAGLGVWCPNQLSGTDLSDATVTTLFGVDRSSNSRLYGTFVDATGGGSILSACIDAVQEIATMTSVKRVDLFASKVNYATVAKDLQNAVQYVNNPANKAVGTKQLLIYSDDDTEGYLNVSKLTDDNKIWGVGDGAIKPVSIGGLPHIDAEDGLPMARMGSSAAYETRWFQQGVYEVKKPVALARIQLNAEP
jgi:hypothetical protein